MVTHERELVLERAPLQAPEFEADTIRALDNFLTQNPEAPARLVGPNGDVIVLPGSVCAVLKRAVHEMASGHAVTILPVHAELTTQQAAELLNVSRPFLINLLEAGTIPFHQVGSHRRVRLSDVLAYRHQRSQARRSALLEMAREAQNLDLYE